MVTPKVALAVKDLLARTRLQDAAEAEGWELTTDTSQADLAIVDLDQPNALADLGSLRVRNPLVPVVGFVSHVDVERRTQAEALGVTVMTRGAAASGAREIFRSARP
jgi:hypothetical protein